LIIIDTPGCIGRGRCSGQRLNDVVRATLAMWT